MGQLSKRWNCLRWPTMRPIRAFHAGLSRRLSRLCRTRRPRPRSAASRSPRASAVSGGQAFGPAGAYENVRGLIHGELDPKDARNRLIQDLDLAPRNARGQVEYVATFSLMKPIVTERASGVLMYSVVNRGNGAPVGGTRGAHLARQRLAGRRRADGQQPDDQGARRQGPGRRAHHRPGARQVLRPARGNDDGVRSGLDRWARRSIRPSRSTRRVRRCRSTEPRRRAAKPAALVPSLPPTGRSPTAAPRRSPARPIRRRVCVKGGFDPARVYELVYTAKDPLVLGHRPGRHARHRLVLPARGGRRRGQPEPGRRGRPARHRRRAVAVGQLPQDVRPPRVQRRPVGTHRLRRRHAADRGAADADELPVRGARRRRHALRAGQRAGGLVGPLHRRDARAAGGEPARSLHGHAHLPEGRRGDQLGRVLGAAHVARPRRHRRGRGHPAARQRPPLLQPRHDARRRPGRLRARAAGRGALRPAGEPEPDGRDDPRADAGAGGLGRQGNARRRRAATRGSRTERWWPPRGRPPGFRPFPASASAT